MKGFYIRQQDTDGREDWVRWPDRQNEPVAFSSSRAALCFCLLLQDGHDDRTYYVVPIDRDEETID